MLRGWRGKTLAGILSLLGALGVARATPSVRAPWAADRPLPEATLFLEGLVSTPDNELNACFSPDGRTLFFAKSQPPSVTVLVVSHYREGECTKPEIAPFRGSSATRILPFPRTARRSSSCRTARSPGRSPRTPTSGWWREWETAGATRAIWARRSTPRRGRLPFGRRGRHAVLLHERPRGQPERGRLPLAPRERSLPGAGAAGERA